MPSSQVRSPTIDPTRFSSKIMQIVLPPEVEALVQRQLTSSKYKSAIEVILAGIKLLEQEEDIYQGRLQELQQDALIGWEASQRGQIVDGAIAMAQIRANLRRRSQPQASLKPSGVHPPNKFILRMP
ncbi:type II toxin-antitoxin system ParD family antitoxin [Kamptonema animale CS-326]|jgi:antitoxin ParD1/3/4|uniref:ribbon-helix-helix domain-containing protein n=1 Tax=Kamptonema animale TaxID=92934 RepID=UPI00232AC694|nr:type II toxin-antitoxin system ParD family antitoxin [Kamptonema animale]MDB9513408.1 type II toxin-antitoxin system ParD family antitoxin [Kamptonema animale CS-326]